jgi:hypothetical protein
MKCGLRYLAWAVLAGEAALICALGTCVRIAGVMA